MKKHKKNIAAMMEKQPAPCYNRLMQMSSFLVVDKYVDDRFSGTDFERPSFKRMIEDIKDGKINCVGTKDSSIKAWQELWGMCHLWQCPKELSLSKVNRKGSDTMALAQTKVYSENDYYDLPEDVRAELIDGQLFYNQAAPSRIHQTILMELSGTIRNYIKSNGGFCRVYPAPFAVKLSEDKTIVEPDISVICDQNKLTDRGCTGAPDWIIEIISPGNPSHDYIRKLSLYADAGVREYWIVDPRIEKVFVYYLEQTDLQIGTYTFNDKIKANIYDDLWIDFRELDL